MDLAFLKSTWHYLSVPLFEISGNKVSVLSVLMAVFLIILATKGSRLSSNVVRRILSEKDIDPGIKGSIEKIVRYFVLIIGTLIALDTLGISLSSLAAVGAVLMVGIGFGLQNITQNFISGLIILFERPIKEGDLVEVQGISGRITSIRARSTIINTRDDISIIVPNSQFISEQVVNESFSGEKIRLHVKVGVSYSSDVDLVKSTLEEVAKNHPKVLNSPAPIIQFDDFGDSSLNFNLAFWIRDLWDCNNIKSEIRFAIAKAFKDKNIEIPFPQRTVHLPTKNHDLS